jgi:hypothetical protein
MLLTLEGSYAVDDDVVRITVTPGEGQKAHVKIWISDVPITSGTKIVNFPIGRGSDVAGKDLDVATTVTDTNPQTNRTSVTYILAGGSEDHIFNQHFEVSKEGETVDYFATFKLLK